VTAGQVSEHKVAPYLVQKALESGALAMAGDKGYDSNATVERLENAGVEAVIPPKKNRKVQRVYDQEKYRKRHKIENINGALKEYRRVATRYDKLASHYLGFVAAAAIANILKTIC